MKKHIEYYYVKLGLSVYNHDNNPALTMGDLYLSGTKSEYRFKDRGQAEEFAKKVKELAKRERRKTLTHPNNNK